MTTVCSVNPRFGFEAVDRYIGTAAGESKKVAVIGGGPGGMRTALYLADRGHRVTIFEAQDKLGRCDQARGLCPVQVDPEGL